MCKNPYMNGSLPCPCGQCNPCRINRRRVWTHRIMLESYVSPASCFLTLTYDDDNLPAGNSLRPDHVTNFLKRLRKGLPAGSLRYFFVGEYGEHSARPHYHAALFGLGPESAEICSFAWGKGFSYTGSITPRSAQYIAGYVVKKMTSQDDARLNGRFPEFARMSLRSGIGAGSVPLILDAMTSDCGAVYLDDDGDVPGQLKIDSKMMPLGRYLKGKLRNSAGVTDVQKTKYETELRAMHALAKDNPAYSDWAVVSLKHFLLEKNAGAVALLESRSNLYSKKGSL